MERKLYRSRSNRMIAGVCGGLAAYFNIDPTIVRLIAVLSIFLHGFGILAYIILAIVVPLESSKATEPREAIRENVEEIKNSASKLGDNLRSTFSPEKGTVTEVPKANPHGLGILGVLLIVFGLVFLASNFINIFSWFNWSVLWPLILVAIGALVILSSIRR